MDCVNRLGGNGPVMSIFPGGKMKSYLNPQLCCDHRDFMKQPFRIKTATPGVDRFIQFNETPFYVSQNAIKRGSQHKNITRRAMW